MLAVLHLVSGLARLAAAQTARRVGVASGLMALAMLFVMIGVTGLVAALWIVLAREIGPATAALVMGGTGFGVAALLMLIASLTMKARRPLVSPELEVLLAEFKAHEAKLGLWAPLAGAVVLGFLAAAGRGRK